MNNPTTVVDANQLINEAITAMQDGNTEQANQRFEEAAQIYEQNGDSENASDARALIITGAG